MKLNKKKKRICKFNQSNQIKSNADEECETLRNMKKTQTKRYIVWVKQRKINFCHQISDQKKKLTKIMNNDNEKIVQSSKI